MEVLSNVDEEILFTSVAKIGEMSATFKKLARDQPQDYFVLRPHAVHLNVTNGGPSFHFDDKTFDKWLVNTRSKCPLLLRHIMNFFRPLVGSNRGGPPEPKEVLQPRLRAHAAAYLTASQVTAHMTINSAVTKLRESISE